VDDQVDDISLVMQGIEDAGWLTPAAAELARQTNDRVRTIADRELEPGLSPADFTTLLIEAAQRAEARADSRS
jgi:hypothetical protein